MPTPPCWSGPRLAVLLLVSLAWCTLGARAAAQPPQIPPGYTLVDDLILPATDSGFTGLPWPGGIVPYAFDPAVSVVDQVRARTAMAEIEAIANVTFVPRTIQTDYMVFQNCSCNAAYLGMTGGAQPVQLYNWNVKYIVVHEIFHTLDFIHEQSRPDRNLYVTINYGNIQQGMQPQFDIAAGAVTPGPYDFLSIMHYGQNFFSTGSGPTIVCNPPYAQYQGQLGNQSYLTVLDAQGMAARYGAPPAPAITAMVPESAPAGSPALTITLTGQRFYEGAPGSPGVPGSVVRWDGGALPTTYVNPTTLTAVVAASLLVAPGCHTVTVDNAVPGGALSNRFTFAVGLNTCAPNVEYQLNGPLGSFDFDGVQAAGIFGPPAAVVKPYGGATTAHFAAPGSGQPWDAVFAAAPARPLSVLGLYTLGRQVVNVDLGPPGWFFFSTGTAASALPSFPGSFALTFNAPLVTGVVTGQMLVAAPANPDGFALSQAAELQTRNNDPCAVGAPVILADDSYAVQTLGFSYPHFGTSWTRVFVGSNGRLTFNVGSISALNTFSNLFVGPPAIAALWADLDPGSAGTVLFHSDGYGSFGVCFQAVPNHGMGNANTLSLVARSGVEAVLTYGTVTSPTALVGLAPGGAQGTPLPLDLSNGPYTFPAGRVPYESFAGNLDLSGRTLTFTLDASGRPVGLH